MPITPTCSLSLADCFLSFPQPAPGQNPKTPATAVACKNRRRDSGLLMIQLLKWIEGGLASSAYDYPALISDCKCQPWCARFLCLERAPLTRSHRRRCCRVYSAVADGSGLNERYW